MSDQSFTPPPQRPLRPASFTATGEAEDNTKTGIPPSSVTSRKLLSAAALTLLLVAVLLTLLWQPSKNIPEVSEPSSPVIADNQSNETNVPPSQEEIAAPTEPERPWETALAEQSRSEAQEILAKLLPLQSKLIERQASLWANLEFREMQDKAAEADQDYAQQNFDQALDGYRQALATAEQLNQSIEPRIAEALTEADELLESGDFERAKVKVDLALIMEPDNSEAISKQERVAVNEEVFYLINQSTSKENNDELDQALDSLKNAQQLDSNLSIVNEKIANLETRIEQQNYVASMSSAFSAMSNDDYSTAEHNFRRALSYRPNDPAALGGLEQLEAQRQISTTDSMINRALKHEANEQWEEALDIFTELQDLDDTLVQARLGILRSSARDTLDKKLKQAIAEPLALQSNGEWQNSNGLLLEAKNVQNRGPILSQQIELLEYLLEQSRIPRTVLLSSDSMTEVEIYRVGRLGKFRNHVIELNPGKYVAVGSRSGYRDVRIEFTVDIDQSTVDLAVAASEPVSL